MSECGQCACCYEKHDQCAVDKTEAAEFAYFSGYVAARTNERERIIKLLEGIYDYPQGWNYDDPIASVIALIKGENK